MVTYSTILLYFLLEEGEGGIVRERGAERDQKSREKRERK
jgi:hypothetical protein